MRLILLRGCLDKDDKRFLAVIDFCRCLGRSDSLRLQLREQPVTVGISKRRLRVLSRELSRELSRYQLGYQGRQE